MGGQRILVNRQMEHKRQEIIEYLKIHPLAKIVHLSKIFSVDRTTITRWRNEFPEFNQAFIDAEEGFIDEVEAFYEEACRKDPELAGKLLQVRRKDKWANKNHLEIGENSIPINFNFLPPTAPGKIENIQDVDHIEIKPDEDMNE
jgi:hypothetical protein